MSTFTFPSVEQVFEGEQLAIFKQYGTKAALTDFAILLGGYVSSGTKDLKNRPGWWWTRSSDGDNDARAVNNSGNEF